MKRQLAHMARVDVASTMVTICAFADKWSWLELCEISFNKAKDSLLQRGKNAIASESSNDQ